jgi:hypothetical protein
MDLLDMVTKGLGSDFASKAAGMLGESAQGTQGLLGSALPLLFSGLASKAAAPDGGSEVLKLLNSFGASDAQLSNIGGLLTGGGSGIGDLVSAGSSILSALFGNRTNDIFGALSSLSGVKLGSATKLVSAVAPLAFGLLRRHTAKEGLGASGLASLLLGQRDALARQVPEGLSRAAGFAPVSSLAAAPEKKSSSGFLRWLPWIIGAILALWLLSRCVGTEEMPPAPPPPPAASTAPAVATPAMATLYFDSGSAAPAADAGSTLEAIADYAKANPSARVAVSGFHDPSGDAAVNEEVAKNRATAVRDVLVGLGVPESQVDLDRPLVTEGGAEERASRRVEVSIR